MPIAKGATVRQRVDVIEGPVKSIRFDEDEGKFFYLVEYTPASADPEDPDAVAERWFSEDEIEEAE